MADQRPKWTFAGKPVYSGAPASFELPLGVAPGEGVVVLTEADADDLILEDRPEDLVITDGARTLTVQGLYVHRTEPVQSGGAGTRVVRVYLRDERWKWRRFPKFAGEFNLRTESGTAWKASTVTAGTPWTFDQLLQKVLDALDIGVTANTGVDLTVQLQADYAPAAAVLAAMLRHVPWDLARQPDASYELVRTDGTADWDPPDLPVGGVTVTRTDRGAQRPATARVAFRRYRAKEFARWTPVLKADGLDALGNADSTYAAGEWVKADDLISHWGGTIASVRGAFYSKNKGDLNRAKVAFGGDDLGGSRWNHIKQALYRVFRLDDTDRDDILPLTGPVPVAGTQTGREVWGGPLPGPCVYHLPRTQMGEFRPQGASRPYFIPLNGRPYGGIKLVNSAEGIIAFQAAHPICPVTVYQGLGTVEQDFQLEAPSQVRVTVGWIAKGSTDPDTDRYIVSKTLPEPNNGETETFINHDVLYAEEFDLIDSDYGALNEPELQAAADELLEQYAATFQQRDGERHTLVGVDGGAALDGTVRTIRWDADTRGTSSTYRLYDEQPVSGIPAKAREVQIALSGERATLVDVGAIGTAGGGHRFGSLDNNELPYKEHSSAERSEGPELDTRYSFFTPHEGGLLVAAERIRPASGDDPCGGAPTTTQPGTKGPQVSGGNSGGGAPKISGGPADQGG